MPSFTSFLAVTFAGLATAASSSSSSPWPTQSYLSEPSLHPLKIQTNVTGRPAPGYTFLATDGSVAFPEGGGPRIVEENGDDIYIAKGHAFNFGPRTYKGSQVLASWNGTVFPEPVGRGSGYVLILDNSYKVVANVTLPGPFLTLNVGQQFDSNIDLHEIFITDQNTMIVTANNVTTADLTTVGGDGAGWVVEAQFYEIDIESNEILFSWKSLDHLDQIPFTDSVYPLGEDGFDGSSQDKAWGYFHINAASPSAGGYIISSRFLCSVISVEKSGHIQWRVQGIDGGDFSLVNNATFCYQHNARTIFADEEHVIFSIHDNANSPLTEPNPTTPTSGLIIELDLGKKTATKVARYQNPGNEIYSTAQGNYQGLPNGNILMGHGFTPIIEEFSGDGKIVATSQFGPVVQGQGSPSGGIFTYKAFRSDWSACPAYPPKVATEKTGNQLKVAVSWNGATDVESWTIYAGDSEADLQKVNEVAKTGFETVTEIKCANYIKVEARGCSWCKSNEVKSSGVVAVEC